ncbi:MAG: beta-lactamase family protein [Acidobacteriia bacterium]|nr:beta-lactamase family protein [Terriglobia bacterium]
MPFRLALAWILLSTPIFADPCDAARDFIRARLTERQVPSITVAVARDGKILWEEGFGWADRDSRVAANEHTLYSLASITKPFTATALMTLVEKKRIDLDRPLNDYLATVEVRARVGNADDASVRRLANHSSGLPAHGQFFLADGSARPPSMEETVRRFGNLVTIPGEKWEYSDLGYGILGDVVSHLRRLSERGPVWCQLTKMTFPLVLNALASGEVPVQLRYQLKMLLNGVTWANDTIVGAHGWQYRNRRGRQPSLSVDAESEVTRQSSQWTHRGRSAASAWHRESGRPMGGAEKELTPDVGRRSGVYTGSP